jgi:hypothetical protein
MPPFVTLTPQDIVNAATVASYKFIESRVKNAKRLSGQEGDKELRDKLLGFTGEAAFAQIIGEPYPTARTFNFDERLGGDFSRPSGTIYEIKASWRPFLWEFKKWVYVDRTYVLMRPVDRTFLEWELMGWCPGQRLKASQHLPRPPKNRKSFEVPLRELQPFTTLPV